jgi:hypothetical protein
MKKRDQKSHATVPLRVIGLWINSWILFLKCRNIDYLLTKLENLRITGYKIKNSYYRTIRQQQKNQYPYWLYAWVHLVPLVPSEHQVVGSFSTLGTHHAIDYSAVILFQTDL